ncbi:MAG: hypothetical protein Aurels2KO_30140 [Aureliella sp.]
MFLLTLLAPAGDHRARAGLAASDVAVVVNANSPNSRTLANHYVALRGIPSINVIFLDSVPASESISIEDFKSKILLPVLQTLEKRKIAGHIQCVAYSADFPTAVNISPQLEKLGELPKYLTPTASINALTFFYQSVLRDDPSYIDFLANRYACREVQQLFASPVGAQTNDAWEAILDLVVDQKHSDAAESAVQLFQQHPQQYPLAYLAAAEFAVAGETEKAVNWMNQAIKAGWHDGDYLAADKRFDSLRDNPQFQVAELLLEPNPSQQRAAWGFSARSTISPNGIRISNPSLGFRYLLSVVLGVTRGQGSTLDQAIACLARASQADFSHPTGKFYFSSTSDVRTTTRAGGFDAAIKRLETMGFDAEIVKSKLPKDASSVLGAQIGTATTDWSKSGSRLAPGAIIDNLTSYGGVMNSTSQTKLTHFLASGAAGSSGTVTEPYALQPKFPHPQMYAHYAAGASLAEAFYLSVTGPYQLLIVGDPLCKPFSHAPKLQFGPELRRVKPTDVITLNFPPSAKRFLQWDQDSMPRGKRSNPMAPSAISVLTDGRNPKSGRVQARVAIKMASFSPGYHELTLRLAADDPLVQRSDWPLALLITGDHAVQVTTKLESKPLPTIDTGDEAEASYRIPGAQTCYAVSKGKQASAALSVACPGAKSVSLWHEQEELQSETSDKASFTVDTKPLGLGPVRMWAKAQLPDGTTITSPPIVLMIER